MLATSKSITESTAMAANIDPILVRCLEQIGVEASQIRKAIEYSKELNERLETLMVSMGVLDQEQLALFYSLYLGLDVFDPLNSEFELLDEVLNKAPLQEFMDLGCLPFSFQDEHLHVACTDPMSHDMLQFWQVHAYPIKLCICSPRTLDDIRTRIESEQQEDSLDTGSNEIARLRELAFGAPTVNLVNSLIVKGIKLGASDLHIEPISGKQRARFRIDGVLQESDSIPSSLQNAVLSRIKILSGMDIAEKRRPQDGKIETRVAGVDLDIRCSSLPLGEGESMVMRFLVKKSTKFELSALGYEPDLVEAINQDLKKTSGVVLMTGPTGSGKTTSLYSFLDKLNQPDVKIITLEDPVEYQLDGINQVQVRSDIGFDFSAGLRSIVRQDPDIIMIGEIRDQETARIAMQSSLTGHLVFSTVHTNDAPSTYTRLLDLGIEDYLLNAALVSIMAQRLVRTLCAHCAVADDDVLTILEREDVQEVSQRWLQHDATIRKPVGCDHCGGSGYSGRMAILEYMPCNESIQALEKNANFLLDAKQLMNTQGFRTLKQDGILKMLKGHTSLEEVMRVAG